MRLKSALFCPGFFWSSGAETSGMRTLNILHTNKGYCCCSPSKKKNRDQYKTFYVLQCESISRCCECDRTEPLKFLNEFERMFLCDSSLFFSPHYAVVFKAPENRSFVIFQNLFWCHKVMFNETF